MPFEATVTTPHARAVIDLQAVAHNTALFAAHTEAAVMAVVKADGFGQVATAALASGATWLGVTTCAEALHLRLGGITAPILSWMHHPEEDFSAALLAEVDLSVSSSAHLRSIARDAVSGRT
jgi:alanine racemase